MIGRDEFISMLREDSPNTLAEGISSETPETATLIELIGSRRDVYVAEGLRTQAWTGVLQWLTRAQLFGASGTDIDQARRQAITLFNRHPEATWWLNYFAQQP